MKLHKPIQRTQREDRIKKTNERNGLAVAILILFSTLVQTQTHLSVLGGLLAIVAVGALILSFVSGYKRSDELEKQVQLKSAAICFALVMFIAFAVSVAQGLNDKMFSGSTYLIYDSGFLLHLFILPHVAKRTYEK
jgi:ABC-type Na+ efflux pump permease subunit